MPVCFSLILLPKASTKYSYNWGQSFMIWFNVELSSEGNEVHIKVTWRISKTSWKQKKNQSEKTRKNSKYKTSKMLTRRKLNAQFYISMHAKLRGIPMRSGYADLLCCYWLLGAFHIVSFQKLKAAGRVNAKSWRTSLHDRGCFVTFSTGYKLLFFCVWTENAMNLELFIVESWQFPTYC